MSTKIASSQFIWVSLSKSALLREAKRSEQNQDSYDEINLRNTVNEFPAPVNQNWQEHSANYYKT